ncbi:hypothetical protein CAPTEDRAFT_191087 [Capitella teleta]|uniref:Uncharacterized protein n=1 Tax=Capitella teleta TaxID=283909 RepID=R7URD6_CAPTE|nr:hypothetical protein CAPTEDRAFT_191087 [Capitella teleta]|eukprot:ELU06487.1 hypothetical protein CAPTEDRAFT_191087 [Capitella teleta]
MAMMKLKLFLFMCYAVVTTVHSAGDSDTQADGAFEGLTANGSDVGINMHPDSMIRYEIDRQSEVTSTVDETLIIEFSTDMKQGTLMSITNDDPSQKEFISVEMNNNGCYSVALIILTHQISVSGNLRRLRKCGNK